VTTLALFEKRIAGGRLSPGIGVPQFQEAGWERRDAFRIRLRHLNGCSTFARESRLPWWRIWRATCNLIEASAGSELSSCRAICGRTSGLVNPRPSHHGQRREEYIDAAWTWINNWGELRNCPMGIRWNTPWARVR